MIGDAHGDAIALRLGDVDDQHGAADRVEGDRQASKPLARLRVERREDLELRRAPARDEGARVGDQLVAIARREQSQQVVAEPNQGR